MLDLAEKQRTVYFIGIFVLMLLYVIRGGCCYHNMINTIYKNMN